MTTTVLPSALDAVVDRVHEISSIPQVALRVIELTNDPNAGAEELKTVMENDASLSARVLRLINSSAYGIRHEVTHLQMAITYLGFRQIRNLALTASISDVFRNEDSTGAYSRSGLWRHMVSVGVTSRLLAMRRSIENFEDVFLAGLLHDIGIILEDQLVRDRFCRMLLSGGEGRTLEEREQEFLGFTHTQLGAAVAKQWRFPSLVGAAIRHHHAPRLPADEHQRAIRCVQLANSLCTLKKRSSVGTNLLRPPIEAIRELELSKPDIEALLVDLDEEFQRQSALFAI